MNSHTFKLQETYSKLVVKFKNDPNSELDWTFVGKFVFWWDKCRLILMDCEDIGKQYIFPMRDVERLEKYGDDEISDYFYFIGD